MLVALAKRNWPPLSKRQFLKLNRQEQLSYLRQYPESSHATSLNMEHKGDVTGEVNEVHKKVLDNHAKSEREVNRDIAEYQKVSAPSHNAKAFQALRSIKRSDLVISAKDIDTKRNAIIAQIQRQSVDHPKMYANGLSVASAMLDGEQPDLTPSKAKALEHTLVSIGATALLASSVLLMVVAAGPAGAVLGRALYEYWYANHYETDELWQRIRRKVNPKGKDKKDKDKDKKTNTATASAYVYTEVINDILSQYQDILNTLPAQTFIDKGNEMFGMAFAKSRSNLAFVIRPDERKLPHNKRSEYVVVKDGLHVGTVEREDNWIPKIFEGYYDPFQWDHEPDDRRTDGIFNGVLVGPETSYSEACNFIRDSCFRTSIPQRGDDT